MTRYDTIQEFNVVSKAECDQLNLAHYNKQESPAVAGKPARRGVM